MNRALVALAAAVLGTGCIVTNDTNPPPSGTNVVDFTWDFVRYAPAQPGQQLVYDPSLVGTTGPCHDSRIDTVTVDSPALAAPITVSCVHQGVQGVRTGAVATGTQTFTITAKRGGVALYQSTISVPVSGFCDSAGNCNPVTVDLGGFHAPVELWADFQNGSALAYGTCAAAGYPTVTYTITDWLNNTIAQSPVAGITCASGNTPLLVVDANDASPTKDFGNLDFDTYRVAMIGFLPSDPNNAPTYHSSCPASFDHFATQIGNSGVAFVLNTATMTCQ